MRPPFNDLVQAQVPRLRRYARQLTRRADAADDLVNETVARATAKQHLFEPGTDLRAWLFTILHNQHVNFVRREARRGIEVPADGLAEILTADERTDGSVETDEVELALGLLPSEQREALILVGLEDMSYEQAAYVLGVPVGTVRSRLSRGRDLLIRLLHGTCAGEPGHTKATLRSVTAEVNKARRRARYL